MGWTPLMEAADQGRKDAVQALIDARADVHVKSNDGGLTALHFVAWRGYTACVQVCGRVCVTFFSRVAELCVCAQMLLGAGAEVDAMCSLSETALQKSVRRGRGDCTALLLDAGAKLSHLGDDLEHPEWFTAMLKRRSNCRNGALILYGVLRKRRLLFGRERVPRDIISMLTRAVWDTRHDDRWA